MIRTILSSLRIIFYLFILVLVYVFYLSRDLPSLERLETFDPAMLSTLYDRNGEVIGEFYIQKRVFVDIEEMPESNIKAKVKKRILGLIFSLPLLFHRA